MAKTDKKTGSKIVRLSRMYTYAGRHWGPGDTEVPEGGFGARDQDNIVEILETAEKRDSGKQVTATREVDEKSGSKSRTPKQEETPPEPTEEELRAEGEKRGIPGAEAMDIEQLKELLKSD